MTPRGNVIANRFASDLEDLIAHHDREPDEAASIMIAIIARIQAITVGNPSLTEKTGVEG